MSELQLIYHRKMNEKLFPNMHIMVCNNCGTQIVMQLLNESELFAKMHEVDLFRSNGDYYEVIGEYEEWAMKHN